MGSAREKTQADFDLERFIDMFDEALTSKDERVINALRSLMMMVILTKPEDRNPMADRDSGPLRQLYDDVRHINRRLHHTEDTVRELERNVQAHASEKFWKVPEAKAQTASDFWRESDIKYDYYKGAIRKLNSPDLLAQINPSKINKEI
jgi:hypothetical protein